MKYIWKKCNSIVGVNIEEELIFFEKKKNFSLF